MKSKQRAARSAPLGTWPLLAGMSVAVLVVIAFAWIGLPYWTRLNEPTAAVGAQVKEGWANPRIGAPTAPANVTVTSNSSTVAPATHDPPAVQADPFKALYEASLKGQSHVLPRGGAAQPAPPVPGQDPFKAVAEKTHKERADVMKLPFGK